MTRLLVRGESLLLVVDAQPAFYRAIALVDSEALDRADALAATLDRAAWLAGVATALDVPAVVTEEDAPAKGPTAPAILAALPDGTRALAKTVFGAADQPDILAAIEATGRRTAVVVGIETDVCIAHTAMGLLDRGLRTVVVEDATFAPPGMHEAGLRRIAAAGGEIAHAKGVYYEWIRTLAAARAFEREHPDLAEPPGFSL